jgi:saccharopine dehydrogenase (NADP+, L-glutamate forming)
MKTILVAGAGKSATYLINYLLIQAEAHNWRVVIIDGHLETIESKIAGRPRGQAVAINITDAAARQPLVEAADIVLSLMPPHLHILLAQDCLLYGKHLITSSYASPEMLALSDAARAQGLLFLCEMGLDPGIDHMSAAQIAHRVAEEGGVIDSFKSYCGGLVAPESDTNPWHYKIAWNPRNILLAGAGGARFEVDGQELYIPYERLYENAGEIPVAGYGSLAFYPNRDSMRYPDLYHTPQAKTFMRATLRHPDFCKGWDAVIAMGWTDETKRLPEGAKTYADVSRAILGTADFDAGLQPFISSPDTDLVRSMLHWLGLFDETPLPEDAQTLTDAMLPLLEAKWVLQDTDKDLVVMVHDAEYVQSGTRHRIVSTMTLEGKDKLFSAMAKTVGMPMALFAEMLLEEGAGAYPKGVQIPNLPQIYEPVLERLADHGIRFNEVLN